jgi:hypothetical protein
MPWLDETNAVGLGGRWLDLPKPREQVRAEVAAAQGPEESLSLLENVANWAYWPVQILSRMFPTTALRDAMEGTATAIAGTPPEYYREIFDRPLISPEAAKDVIRFFDPTRQTGSPLEEGTQNFLANLASGLTTFEGVTGLASGKVSPALPAISFGGPMVQQIPQLTEQTVYGEGPEQVESALGLALSTVAPAAMTRGAIKSMAPKPSGFVPEFRMTPEDIEVVISGKDIIPPSRQLPRRDVVPPSRQLPLNVYQPASELAPAGGASFVVDPAARTIPVEQLSPKELREAMRGPRKYAPREEQVRPAQQPPVVIGQQPLLPQRLYLPDLPRPSQEVVLPPKPPIEPSGGEISFRAPAAAEGIPNQVRTAFESKWEGVEKEPEVVTRVLRILDSKDRFELVEMQKEFANAPSIGVARNTASDLGRLATARIREIVQGKVDPELEHLRQVVSREPPSVEKAPPVTAEVKVSPPEQKLITEEPYARTIPSPEKEIPQARDVGEGRRTEGGDNLQRVGQEGRPTEPSEIPQEAPREVVGKPPEPKAKGMRIRAAIEQAKKRRRQAGAWFPKGDEGEKLFSGPNYHIDTTSAHNQQLAKRILSEGKVTHFPDEGKSGAFRYLLNTASKGEGSGAVFSKENAQFLADLGFSFRREKDFQPPPALQSQPVQSFLEKALDQLEEEHGPIASSALYEGLTHRGTYGQTGVFSGGLDFGNAHVSRTGDYAILRFPSAAEAEKWLYENREWFGENNSPSIKGSIVQFEVKPTLEIAGYDLEPFLISDIFQGLDVPSSLKDLGKTSDAAMRYQGLEGFYTKDPNALFDALVQIDKELRQLGWKETYWSPEEGFKKRGLQTRLKPGQGGEKGSIINPFAAIVEKVKSREKELRGETFALSGPRLAIDPKESGFKDPTKPVDAQQFWNRLKNLLPPVERQIYEDAGLDKVIVGKGKISPQEVASILQEGGPETRVVTYGLEGKVSEARKEFEKMTHEWWDRLTSHERGAMLHYNLAKQDLTRIAPAVKDLVDSAIRKAGSQAYVDRYYELKNKIANEPRDTSPRAASIYKEVSALDTQQPMPEWTTTKSGKNLQRVDVVIPLDEATAYKERLVKAMRDADRARDQQLLERLREEYRSVGGEPVRPNTLWPSDQIHEQLPNTLGWAVIQYKTGSKGEKIALITEVQSSWGQRVREDKAEKIVVGPERGQPVNYSGYDHPLLRDYNRLILKAGIDQARKEGATHFVISDARTAMMSEGHDVYRLRLRPTENNIRLLLQKGETIEANRLREGKTVSVGVRRIEELIKKGYDIVPKEEPGMVLNYDQILPKIAEELSGSKGEKVSLGEHKNAYEAGELRSDLIFKETDVAGLMYPIPKATQKFSLFEKDRPESVSSRLYSGVPFLDPTLLKQTGKDVVEIGKATGRLGAKGINALVEPLKESVGRLGGPVGKAVSAEAGQILMRGKKLYAELTPLLDPARKQVGKFLRGKTSWMTGLNKVTDDTAYTNFFGVNEGDVVAPVGARRGLRLAFDANLAIGRLAQRANPGHVPTGRLQRILTNAGYDLWAKGGEGREKWARGLAARNNVPYEDVKRFFDKTGRELGDPATSPARLDKIAQDFVRRYPKTITHVRTATGWHEVIVSNPFDYLKQAAQRTANAVAFREIYPLIEHEGKWVDSGKLAATREAFKKELVDARDITKFDNLIRALQGHPLDVFRGDISTITQTAGRTVGELAKSAALTLNAPVNLSETFIGAPAIFLGYKNLVPAAKRLLKDGNFWDQLELTGARDKAMYDYSIRPRELVRSGTRVGTNVIRKLTGQQFLNEVQEGLAAATAKVYTDRIREGRMSNYELNRARALFRAMGFTKEQSSAMTGTIPEAGRLSRIPREDLLKQFETGAAAWLTSGNKALAEMSRLGASRLFKSIFWFWDYPMTRMNQFWSVARNWVDDVGTYLKEPTRENWVDVYHDSALLGRQLGGVPMQGAFTLAVLAGVSGGFYGLKALKDEMLDDKIEFIKDAAVSGMGGLLSVLNRLSQNVEGGDSLTREITRISGPATLASDFIDMGLGSGRYAGMDVDEKISTFLESRTAASKAVRTGLAVAGLSKQDLELDVAIKAFYRWRRDQPGFTTTSMGGTPEQLALRVQMRKVKRAIQQGGDWVSELKKVADSKAAADSLKAGTLLEINGKSLTEEQLAKLRKRIGSKLVDRLQTMDTMVREVARGISEREETGERKAPESLPTPTGRFAIDFDTSSKRSERVMGQLSEPVRAFITDAEISSLDYTPTVPSEQGKKQLTVDEARIMEKAFVEALEELIGETIKEGGIRTENLAVRRNLTQRLIDGARKVALAKALEEIEVKEQSSPRKR